MRVSRSVARGGVVCTLVFIFFVSLASFLLADEKLNFAAPLTTPHILREMQRPGFWISRHPSPDGLILSPKDVQRFNHELIKAGLIKDLSDANAFNLLEGKTQAREQLEKFKHGNYFDREGKLVLQDFFGPVQERIFFDDSKSFYPQYAFVIRQCDQRLLPTDDILTAVPFDFEFDEVQNSSLDIGEASLAMDETQDRKWVYIQTAASAGWVKRENLVFASRGEFKSLLNSKNFAVVISSKADLYRDHQRLKFLGCVRMGTKFTIYKVFEDVVEVLIAPGEHVFIGRQDIQIGYLPYTSRHVIEQAFKMLNAPYGWGGAGGEQDCSAFLKQVFATVGIALPRNSGEQGRSGSLVRNLSEALPGITIVQLNGHIVLYLGMADGRPYAIHEIYAYREHIGGQDRARILNRVVVSDFDLGEGSKKGSLRQRIIAVREVR